MNERKISRRDFLIAAGCGCTAAVLTDGGCARLRGTTASSALICPFGYQFDPYPGQCYRYVDSNGSGFCDLSESATIQTTANSQGESAVPAESAAEGGVTTVILCDRGCGYPGQCGRFIDSDGSGFCDLSEGVAVSSTAAETGSVISPAATPATGNEAITGSELVYLCNRGCSYPGHCHSYTDLDGSGFCDLSEGVPADQVAKYPQPGGRGAGDRGG